MRAASPILAFLQSTLGTGDEIEVPDAALITLDKLPFPINTGSPLLSQDLRGRFGSFLLASAINQGASSGPTSNLVCTFDRGIYRIVASVVCVLLVGPAASSASMKSARVYIKPDTATFAADIMQTGIVVGTPQYDRTDIVVQLPKSGWTLQMDTAIASGVGQSMGVEGTFYISRLL
jgi:hypothetical protein